MRFFVPGEEDTEAAWDRMREACGPKLVAAVGEEGVIAIILGEAFYIFEEGEPRSIPWDSVTESVFCDGGVSAIRSPLAQPSPRTV